MGTHVLKMGKTSDPQTLAEASLHVSITHIALSHTTDRQVNDASNVCQLSIT